MKTPWEQAKERRYQRQERRTASKPGAKAQVNSGRHWFSKRDVLESTPLGHVLTDNKDTEGQSFTIKKLDWLALKKDAIKTPPGCHPSLQIDIQDVRLRVIGEDLWDEINKYVALLEAEIAHEASATSSD
jgi:hypothetical protein